MKKNLTLLASIITSIVFAASLPIRVLATQQPGFNQGFYSANNILYYNPDACDAPSSGSSSDPITPSGSGSTPTTKEFVSTYTESAYKIGQENGIPWEIIMAQAGLESGWGKSGLTQKANNFFGIKAGSSWTGQTVTMPTKEQTKSGASYKVNAAFRVYASPAEGFQGYADLILKNKIYAEALKHPNDMKRYIEEIKKAGYATDKKYVESVLNAAQTVVNALGGDYGTKYKKSADIDYKTTQKNFPSYGSSGSPSSGSDASSSSSSTNGTSSCACPTNANVGDINLSGNNNAEKMFNFYVSQGYTKEGAAGLIGSQMLEAGGNTYNIDPKARNPSGYMGIVQWSPNDRWPKLQKWAAGKDPLALETQLGFVVYELQNDYKVVGEKLKTTKDVTEAATIVSDKYEIGGHRDIRIKNAQKAFKDFSGNTADSSSPSGASGSSSSSCGNSSATIVGDFAFPLLVNKSMIKNKEIFANGTTQKYGHPYMAYDIVVDPGKQVVAAKDGVVTGATSTDRCGGRVVIVQDPTDKLYYTYMHMGSASVSKGDQIKAGQQVGVVGGQEVTCNTVPHLHFDVSKPGPNGRKVSCSRLSCSNTANYVDAGKPLFDAYQALPN